MSILIYSSKALTSEFHHSLIQMIKSAETISTDIDILTNYKSNRPIEILEEMTGHKYNVIRPYLDNYPVKRKYKDWAEIYDEIDVSMLSNYTHFIIFGSILSEGSNLRRNEKRKGVFPYDAGQIGFISVGVTVYYSLAIAKAAKLYNIPVHEMVLDPQEFSMDQYHLDYIPKMHHLYHGVDIPEYNMKRLDSLQYYLNNKQESFMSSLTETKKEYDFTFGYTVLTLDRGVYSLEDIFEKFEKKNIFIKNKFTDENSFIPRDEYLKYIKKSYYTLIIPSYDKKSISVYRIIESLYEDCLPLLHPDVNISDIETSFDVDMTPLVIKEDWTKFSASKYQELLTYYKQKFLTYERGFILD